MGGRRRRYEFPEGGLYRFRRGEEFRNVSGRQLERVREDDGYLYFDETSKKLTGKYSDGENWAYDYTVSGVDWLFGQLNQETGEMSGVGETMVMTAADDSTYKLTFVYGIIPDEVINSVMVRSAEGVRIL